ncbi:DELTA-thalatoxin-Avl1b-like [Gadus chalcogrammus]|uniref:DELTA-thalatoxin-Avl1b-like n=1 Tax=Gadus chalcogrammus TaxID=1042646 RepID=UPI0024C4C572|nr:DELTA-thalatoxin-Avl1b-like [Gadus chalcogrammus]XP_056465651.1 DELTA-thalatoxin-Avl1b-like [Gadus chalcogrammus]
MANPQLEDLVRGCYVELKNSCSTVTLTNPQLYIERGRCSVPLALNLGPKSSRMATFVKTSGTATGAVGVLTYDLVKAEAQSNARNIQLKLAVMYSVPFNRNSYTNWFAIGLMNSQTKCCQELYSRMYYNDVVQYGDFDRAQGGGSSLQKERDHVVVQASMSDTGTALLRVEVTEK